MYIYLYFTQRPSISGIAIVFTHTDPKLSFISLTQLFVQIVKIKSRSKFVNVNAVGTALICVMPQYVVILNNITALLMAWWFKMSKMMILDLTLSPNRHDCDYIPLWFLHYLGVGMRYPFHP